MKKNKCFLPKAGLCLCLLCWFLLSGCVAKRGITVETVELKHYKLVLLLQPGADFNSLAIPVVDGCFYLDIGECLMELSLNHYRRWVVYTAVASQAQLNSMIMQLEAGGITIQSVATIN